MEAVNSIDTKSIFLIFALGSVLSFVISGVFAFALHFKNAAINRYVWVKAFQMFFWMVLFSRSFWNSDLAIFLTNATAFFSIGFEILAHAQIQRVHPRFRKVLLGMSLLACLAFVPVIPLATNYRVMLSSSFLALISGCGAWYLIQKREMVFFQNMAGGIFGLLVAVMLFRVYYAGTVAMDVGLLSKNLLMALSIFSGFLVVYTLPLVLVYSIKQLDDQRIAKKHEELEVANDTKDRLFTIIAHDLRAPVRNLESLLGEAGEGENPLVLRQIHKIAKVEVNKASELLESLLQWSRTQLQTIEVSAQLVNIESLIEENRRLLESGANKKKIGLKTEYSGDLHAWGDLEMVKLVIRNLLNNAIKFTPKGGEVVLSAQGRKTFVEIAVKDTGVGMEVPVLEHLFSSKIQSQKGTGGEKGTGLGLLLCKEFVELNGGEIWALSEKGQGSCFTFTLPRK